MSLPPPGFGVRQSPGALTFGVGAANILARARQLAQKHWCPLNRILPSRGRARCPQRAGTGLRRAGLLYAKVCANREDFRDATGARTFLSAATPECSTGAKRSRALLPFNVAADKNVRAPLWFRLRRPGDSAPYRPAVSEAIQLRTPRTRLGMHLRAPALVVRA